MSSYCLRCLPQEKQVLDKNKACDSTRSKLIEREFYLCHALDLRWYLGHWPCFSRRFKYVCNLGTKPCIPAGHVHTYEERKTDGWTNGLNPGCFARKHLRRSSRRNVLSRHPPPFVARMSTLCPSPHRLPVLTDFGGSAQFRTPQSGLPSHKALEFGGRKAPAAI